MKEVEKIIPDTSIIIEGYLSKEISSKKLKLNEITIHEAVIAELEHQANRGRAIGHFGLGEIKNLRDLSKAHNFSIKFAGRRPKFSEIKQASSGEIDSMIRALAYDTDSTLITSDKVQAKVSQAKGIETIYIQPEKKTKKLRLESYFDNKTMSVHLKEKCIPIAKKGLPGKWELTKLGRKKLTYYNIQEIAKEIIEQTKSRPDAYIEFDREGSTIIQFSKFRIVITQPPFSEGWEITAVRPVKKLKLEDYKLKEELLNRINQKAEGILVAGSPGMGKTTFAAALAEYYQSQEKIIKTIEAPRDLDLGPEITQYALSHGTPEEIRDILLLSRPDNVIFDEMRNNLDFKLFADLRLSGIGCLGVVHSTEAIDAIQRFIGRIELGVIPQVIDTVLFIKNGNLDKVLQLAITVKVPFGMTESDLARPIVQIRDFFTGKPEYELYTYGEETVVIKVSEEKRPVDKLAIKTIENKLRKMVSNVKVDILSPNRARIYVPEENVAYIIGKQGKNIEKLEKEIGISLDVQPLEKRKTSPKSIHFHIKEKGKLVFIDIRKPNLSVSIFVDNEFLFTAISSKKGVIRVNRNSEVGRVLLEALDLNMKIECKT